jgi:hypothetical protein
MGVTEGHCRLESQGQGKINRVTHKQKESVQDKASGRFMGSTGSLRRQLPEGAVYISSEEHPELKKPRSKPNIPADKQLNEPEHHSSHKPEQYFPSLS